MRNDIWILEAEVAPNLVGVSCPQWSHCSAWLAADGLETMVARWRPPTNGNQSNEERAPISNDGDSADGK